MNCTKCGKEIEEGENKVCEECRAKLVAEIQESEEVITDGEPKKKKRAKKEKKEIETKEVKTDVEETKETKEKKKTPLKKVFTVAVIIFVIGFIAGVVAGIISNNMTNKSGNTIGNILNSGYAVEDNNNIYFIAPDEELVNVCIYKADKNGGNIKAIYTTEETLISINSVGGNLYFLSLAEEYDNEGNVVTNNKICKIGKDGNGFKVLNDNEFHDYCYEIYVVNDRIYYIGEDVNVYNMDLEGGDRQLVLDKERGYVAITEDYIVYNDYINEEENTTDFETFIYDLATRESKVIVEDQKTYSTTILGEDVYYTDDAGVIYKKSLADLGAEPKEICKTEAYYMNVTEDGIYYMNYTDESAQTISIFRVNLDGTDNKIIKTLESPDGADFINIVGDWVLYTDSDGEDLFMNLTNKYTGEENIRVYNLNIQEYWTKYLAEEETETTDESISLDTTVDQVENTVK